MTKTEFMIECGERLICINTALENDNILEALKARDYNLVCELLDNEF